MEVNVTSEKRLAGSDKYARDVLFEVATTVTAPLAEYVILAAAPSDTGDGQAMAVILRADVAK